MGAGYACRQRRRHPCVAIAQREDDTRVQARSWLGWHHGVHAVGHIAQFAMLFDVVEQVHAEVVEAEVGKPISAITPSVMT